MESVSPAGLLLLLALLQLKHALCDGPLQTRRMVAAKGRYGSPGGLAHAGLHGAGSLLALLAFGMAALPVLVLAAADAVIHYHTDFAKESVVRRAGWTPENTYFWWAMTTDQLVHQLTYLAMALAVTLI
ncbi:DUF3307 domain-containing protein [Aestuariivirga sp.]|uniref:DUF3307 domain-containing protein n=1 Tax=Aestuariivirga sp. TaxID=2650926 RepID=UPI00391D420E